MLRLSRSLRSTKRGKRLEELRKERGDMETLRAWEKEERGGGGGRGRRKEEEKEDVFCKQTLEFLAREIMIIKSCR